MMCTLETKQYIVGVLRMDGRERRGKGPERGGGGKEGRMEMEKEIRHSLKFKTEA